MAHLLSLALCALFTLALTVEPPSPTPLCTPSETSVADRVQFLLLHILGVAAAGVASATRISYATSAALDILLTLIFYASVAVLLAVSLYVTFVFESSDMLLLCAAAGVIVAWRSVPRLWSIQARNLHWAAPMWRTRNGRLFRRVRRPLAAEERSKEEFWNGIPTDSTLVNGDPIIELVELQPRHWEQFVADWQTFVTRGRLGEQPARRAALALRMSYTIPLPAYVPCGKGLYFASRGTLGVEVAREWKIEQKTMIEFGTLSQSQGTFPTLCESRSELAVLLHLQMLLYKPQSPHHASGHDWTVYATEWLFGEMVISSNQPWPDVLASGRISLNNDKHWNLVRKRDERLAAYTGIHTENEV